MDDATSFLSPLVVDRRLRAQLAVSGHLTDVTDVPGFFGRLTATVAELMSADGCLFGRLDGAGMLVGQPDAHGLDSALVAQLMAPCAPGGEGLAERVVFGAEVFRAAVTDDPEFDPYRPVIAALGLRDAIAVPWRAAEKLLGLLVVYNSRAPGGFTTEDVQVLITAAQAAGLVWQNRRSAGDFELQSAITANMAEGVAVIGGDGLIVYANATFAEMFGYGEHELIGTPVSGLSATGPDFADLTAERLLPAIRQSGAWRGEVKNRRRDGSTFWSHANVSRLDHPELGEVWIVVQSDITELKRALEVLAASRDAAEAASKAKSDYLSRMSHELRTPLTAIIGFSDLLLMDERRDRHRDSLEAILKAGEHLLSIINDILDIARIESGRLSLSLEPVLLSTLVEECVSLVAVGAENRGLRLTTDHGGGGIWARGDQQRLKQAFLNLLSNAVKYNRDGGEIVITVAETAQGRVRVSVRDTGPGIQSDRITMLFQPFERLGAERTPVAGTGLGLALTRQLIEAMGGEVGADSVPGHGSTFWIELQGAAPPELSPAAEDEVEIGGVAAESANRRTVLYVEDNLATIGVMQRAFARRPSIRLLTAMQGRLAVQLARSHHPDLVIVDLHLPDLDGDQVLLQLRGDPETRTIPVVILSADATQREIDRLLALGASAYLTKPVRIRRFLDLLDEILQLAPPSRVES